MSRLQFVGAIAMSAFFSSAGLAQPSATSDSAAVVGVVEQYSAALANGDSARALSLLATDALVLESGGVESLGEYRSHHLASDIEFARAVQGTHTLHRVAVVGETAWVARTSTTKGEFRGRTVNSRGAELMVLRRYPTGWRITSIHWSSRAVR